MINAFYSDEVIAGVTWWTDTGSVVAKLTACCCQLHQNHLCTVHHAASIYPDLPSTHSCPSRQCDAHSVLQETVKSSSSHQSCCILQKTCNYAKQKQILTANVSPHVDSERSSLRPLYTPGWWGRSWRDQPWRRWRGRLSTASRCSPSAPRS